MEAWVSSVPSGSVQSAGVILSWRPVNITYFSASDIGRHSIVECDVYEERRRVECFAVELCEVLGEFGALACGDGDGTVDLVVWHRGFGIKGWTERLLSM